MADFGPAKHHADVGPLGLELTHHFGGLHYVPDVDSQPHDGYLARLGRPTGLDQGVHDLLWRGVDRELMQCGDGVQIGPAMAQHIGLQVA